MLVVIGRAVRTPRRTWHTPADRTRRGSSRAARRIGLARQHASRRSADVGAVEVEPDALPQLRHALLGETGVGARGAGLGALGGSRSGRRAPVDRCGRATGEFRASVSRRAWFSLVQKGAGELCPRLRQRSRDSSGLLRSGATTRRLPRNRTVRPPARTSSPQTLARLGPAEPRQALPTAGSSPPRRTHDAFDVRAAERDDSFSRSGGDLGFLTGYPAVAWLVGRGTKATV